MLRVKKTKGYAIVYRVDNEGVYELFGSLSEARSFINLINKGLLPCREEWVGACRTLLSKGEFGSLRKHKEPYKNDGKLQTTRHGNRY